jgi:hypothetical protein
MVEWQPISEPALRDRIAQGVARMPEAHRRLWNAIRIEPQKWELHPYGDAGHGFWVVGIIGRTVIWYNDIEDGFNRSRYSALGKIEDYWCNEDELELTVAYLMNTLEKGADLVGMPKPVKAAR